MKKYKSNTDTKEEQGLCYVLTEDIKQKICDNCSDKDCDGDGPCESMNDVDLFVQGL